MVHSIDIAHGPDRAELIISFLDGKEIIFSNSKGNIFVKIFSIKRENDSGKRWRIEGTLKCNKRQPSFIFNGAYNTKTKRGNFLIF